MFKQFKAKHVEISTKNYFSPLTFGQRYSDLPQHFIKIYLFPHSRNELIAFRLEEKSQSINLLFKHIH